MKAPIPMVSTNFYQTVAIFGSLVFYDCQRLWHYDPSQKAAAPFRGTPSNYGHHSRNSHGVERLTSFEGIFWNGSHAVHRLMFSSELQAILEGRCSNRTNRGRNSDACQIWALFECPSWNQSGWNQSQPPTECDFLQALAGRNSMTTNELYGLNGPTDCQRSFVNQGVWKLQRSQLLHMHSLSFHLAFWGFISFHFSLFGPSFPFIFRLLGFYFPSFRLLGFHFLSFWPLGPSFPFIFAFWAFIFFHSGPAWAFISFYFGLLGFHFLSFSPFGPSFPFILALLGFYFLSFWSFERSFPLILASWAFISLHFGLLGFYFLSFWPFRLSFCDFGPSFLSFWHLGPSFLFILASRPSFPFIFTFWAFIFLSFSSCLGLHFPSFWPFDFHSFHCSLFGLSFPVIFASWAFISFSFFAFGALTSWRRAMENEVSLHSDGVLILIRLGRFPVIKVNFGL